MITIYGREDCAPCITLKRYLDNKGIKYEYHEAKGDTYEMLADVYGYMIPLVTNGTDGMTGLNWPQLNRLMEN